MAVGTARINFIIVKLSWQLRQIVVNTLLKSNISAINKDKAEQKEESAVVKHQCFGNLLRDRQGHVKTQYKATALEAIFGSNADINITDSNGWTASHHAAYNGDYRSVESLLKQGAKINAFSNQFKTPLHLAASQNHPDIVEKLIQTGANLEAQDE